MVPDARIGEAFGFVALREFVGEHGPYGAVGIADGELGAHALPSFQGGQRLADEGTVQHLVNSVVLFQQLVLSDAFVSGFFVEDGAEVQLFVFPVLDIFGEFEHFDFAHHIGDGAEAEFSHDFAQVLREEGKELDDVLGFAGEAFAQFGVLGSDAYGAGVEVAFAHQDTAFCNQGSGSDAPLFGAEEGGDGQVATGAQLAVGLEDDAVAELVAHEGLVAFGQAQFPGEPGVADRGKGRSAGAPVVA